MAENTLSRIPAAADPDDPATNLRPAADPASTVPSVESTPFAPPYIDALPDAFPLGAAGAVIAGRYHLVRSIGEGGMGSVWLAEQRQPVVRQVAVKLVRGDLGGGRVLARFEAERQAIARMAHPHIAKLLDAGAEGGQPYFVMELVNGEPLTAFADRHRLTVGDRLRLFQRVCAAVQHAHQKGVIHRDLKPSNILVESHDGEPVPKVIDFGLAKATAADPAADRSLLTAAGTVLGTPLYMAPEQASFNAADIDTRADVYALGVILYELLTGTTPIEKGRLTTAPLDEVLRVIREEEPPAPSSRVGTARHGSKDRGRRPPDGQRPAVSASRRTELSKLGNLLRGELDWIVLKALNKERDRRYESAGGLADDVGRYMADEPVLAGPPTAGYRLRKFVRRNRVRVAAAAAVLAAVLAGVVGTAVGLVLAVRAADAERTAKQDALNQKARAVAARDQALAALDVTTSTITGESLAAQRAVSPEQKRFLAEVVEVYRRLAEEGGADEATRLRVAQAAYRVGAIEFRLGRKAEAAAAYRTARDRYTELAAAAPDRPEYRRHLAGSLNNLGVVVGDLGDRPAAERSHREALDLRTRLAADFPDVLVHHRDLAASHSNLGLLHTDHGRRADAEQEYRAALAISARLADQFPAVPDYRSEAAVTRANLGRTLFARKKAAEAEKQFRQAVADGERLAADQPGTAEYRFDLATARDGLGLVLAGRKKWAEAEKQHRQAVADASRLTDAHPAVPEYASAAAKFHHHLAEVLVAQRKPADEPYRRAIAIGQAVVAADATVPRYRFDLARVRNDFALLLTDQRQWAAAEAEFRAAAELTEALVDAQPGEPVYRSHLGGVYCGLGTAVRDAGKPADSLPWYAKAVDELSAAATADSPDLTAREFLRNTLACRADAHSLVGKHAEALADWDRAIDLTPAADRLAPRVYRTLPLARSGRSADAVAAVAEFAKSPLWPADVWYTFGCVYAVAAGATPDKKREYADRAVELLTWAVKSGFDDTGRLKTDTALDPLRDRDDFRQLLAPSAGK